MQFWIGDIKEDFEPACVHSVLLLRISPSASRYCGPRYGLAVSLCASLHQAALSAQNFGLVSLSSPLDSQHRLLPSANHSHRLESALGLALRTERLRVCPMPRTRIALSASRTKWHEE